MTPRPGGHCAGILLIVHVGFAAMGMLRNVGDAMNRWNQCVLIGSTLLGSWLGMQATHELGHVAGAWLTGGSVQRVVLHPLTISRTDVSPNPHPLFVVWAGPVFGIALPLALWAAAFRWSGGYLLRFFAGFCLLCNGLYIGAGSFDRVGDCGEMLRHGSQMGHLWLFGALTAPWGLVIWHKLGPHFGLGDAQASVSPKVTGIALAACLALLTLGLVVDGK